ncbi:hypothetical protein PLACP1_05810 [Planifilum fimeticola]
MTFLIAGSLTQSCQPVAKALKNPVTLSGLGTKGLAIKRGNDPMMVKGMMAIKPSRIAVKWV